MKKIMLSIQNYNDRMNIIIALANSGYNVTTRVDETRAGERIYWVIFETLDLNITE